MENLKYTEILQLNKVLATKPVGKPYNIGILSNVTINSLKEILEYSCRVNQIEPNIEIGNFDNIVQDSAIFNHKDLLIIFYDTLNIIDSIDGLFESLDDDSYNNYKQKIFTELSIIFENLKSTPAVIFNTFSDAYYPNNILTPSIISLFIKELNKYLLDFAPANFILIDIDKIYTQLGFKQCIDYRFYLSSKAPYTLSFFKTYVSLIEPILLKFNGKLKKALIFDCDNTLWKGIIGEDGIENIEMSSLNIPGKYFHKIQELAVYLSQKGIIIGLCSKNNEEDIKEVFKNHKDMFLKEENIVITKINWDDKVSNLRGIANDLNIGLESIVFVDDSSFEVNLIKEQLPEVLTLQVPTNLSEYPDFLLKKVFHYFNLSLTSDDVQKTTMYKEQFKRVNAKFEFNNIEDYLASLEIELEIKMNDTECISRISQLTQKTNQFNL
ncbi:MAG TPA: HAD-IIIC family phosphatase, partial [Saprospiraceae bacterium]|nr:HAD-IIIC family phosphatase [Saprospiraceae bacterium]